MHRRLRSHLGRPSPALVIACFALFVALGGSSYAAVTLKRNSVASKHIRNGHVKAPDLAPDGVSSDKVADASLLARDFATGQLPQGPQGPQGQKGDAGEPGTARAYALVDPNTCTSQPGPDPCAARLEKGVTAVERTATGSYCVRAPGLDAATTPHLASVEYIYSQRPGHDTAMPVTRDEFPFCDRTDEFAVYTYTQPPRTVQSHPDGDPVTVAGQAQESNNVGFVIAVP